MVGRDWTPYEIKAVVNKGPHSSALEDDEISKIEVKEQEKAAQGFATIVAFTTLSMKQTRGCTNERILMKDIVD